MERRLLGLGPTERCRPAFAASAAAALTAIGEAARSCDLVSGVSEPRVRSVRLTLWDYEFTVDLVGAREPDGGGEGHLLACHLPEEGRDDWTWANPRGQRQAAIDKNEQTEGIYIPLGPSGEVLAWQGVGGGEQAPPQLPRSACSTRCPACPPTTRRRPRWRRSGRPCGTADGSGRRASP